MTYLAYSNFADSELVLEELLIKNLPPYIKGGTDKHNSNIFLLQTKKALKSCNFIHFNSEQRISFMIFDFDTYENKEAKQTFKNIDSFLNYLTQIIGLEPTFITETNKGYQFAYHLKNQVFTNQPRALNYLNNIKNGLIKTIGCDPHGSIRNYGIWRNPLKHNYYFSAQINYKLKDFKDFIIYDKSPQKRFKRDIIHRQLDNNLLVEGNRNNVIFLATMKWAKNKKGLTINDIFSFASIFNQKAEKPLSDKEITGIARSVYRYYINNKITVKIAKKEIDEGAMGFTKISNLSYEKYLEEVKRRQKLAAQRTNEIVDKSKKREQMLKAKEFYIKMQKDKTINKIKIAVKKLKEENKKITNSAIAKIAGVNRKTVAKYLIEI